MRIVHFVLQGRAAGGLEQLLADVLAAAAPGVEHAVVLHHGDRCEFAGRWPAHTVPWSAEGEADAAAVVRTLRELDGSCLFHSPPHETVTAALGSTGLPVSVLCHGHEWWCASGSRYYAHVSHCCAIRAATAACALRYHAMGCGSLRPANVLHGLARARAGRAALAAAARIVVLSGFMGYEARRHGAGEAAIRLVPAPTAFAGVAIPPPPRATRVLFASRLTREKGVDVLLDAFALLPEVGALDIAGTGIAAGAVATRVAAHPRREAIRLLGHMDRAALRQRLAEASVVVVPSLWPEPYGIIGIEALAHGRPVVACDVGGIGEWAREELGVLKVPAGDAAALAAGLRRVVTEPLWRERAASAGAATVSRRHAPALTAQALAAALQP